MQLSLARALVVIVATVGWFALAVEPVSAQNKGGIAGGAKTGGNLVTQGAAMNRGAGLGGLNERELIALLQMLINDLGRNGHARHHHHHHHGLEHGFAHANGAGIGNRGAVPHVGNNGGQGKSTVAAQGHEGQGGHDAHHAKGSPVVAGKKGAVAGNGNAGKGAGNASKGTQIGKVAHTGHTGLTAGYTAGHAAGHIGSRGGAKMHGRK